MKTGFGEILTRETMLPEALAPMIHQQKIFNMIQINGIICIFDAWLIRLPYLFMMKLCIRLISINVPIVSDPSIEALRFKIMDMRSDSTIFDSKF